MVSICYPNVNLSQQPVKIALLTYSTKPRGSVVHTWELANALHQLGHQVCVYALDKQDGKGSRGTPSLYRKLACEVRLVPAWSAPDDVDGLIRQRIEEFVTFLAAETEDYDIYHAQDCIGANALVQLKQRGRRCLIVRTVHHIEDFQSFYLQACQDKSIRLPDRCLCVSAHWQKALKSAYGIDAVRVVNGVDDARFARVDPAVQTRVKETYGLNGSPTYLTVGGIEPRKNSIRLLQAFAQVRQRQPGAQLVIVGGATLFDYQSYRDRFFQEAAALDLQAALVLPGVVSDADLPGFYHCADVFCFPSVKEGWGLVVLEAIAAGLPVVTANDTPFTEFLTPDQAMLIDPVNVPQIAEAMLTASHPARSHSLVSHSQAVLPNFTWAKSAQMHVQAYQRLMGSA